MESLSRRERERQVREEEIISAAEKVLCEKGFDDASMDEIAREAQFTKRTLYQYFANKEDLYFAVILRGFKKLAEYLEEASLTGRTGYEKIHRSFMGYYKFYKEYPGQFRLMGYIGHVKRKSREDSERRKILMAFNNELFKATAAVIAEGQADGSISTDLDAGKAAVSLIFLMTGFFNQLATTGDTFTQAIALDLEDFSLFSMDLLFRTLKKNSS
ncbi:MAG: TetR/AcrR family transcriptional regulator [Clostridia bacterium]|nr:TetR/AcrR family transcriptional regulator [Clostridia bacterium]